MGEGLIRMASNALAEGMKLDALIFLHPLLHSTFNQQRGPNPIKSIERKSVHLHSIGKKKELLL
jgi:hypothetical protein